MLRDIPDAVAEDAARDLEIEDALPMLEDTLPVRYAPAYPTDEEVGLDVYPACKPVTETMMDTPKHEVSRDPNAKVSTGTDIDDLIARMESCSVRAKPTVGEVIQALYGLLEGLNVTTEPTSMPTSPTMMKCSFEEASSGDEGDDEDWGHPEQPIKRSRSYKERAVKDMGLSHASKTPCLSRACQSEREPPGPSRGCAARPDRVVLPQL